MFIGDVCGQHGVIHYSVANISGAVSRTSTFALTGVTLPYLLQLADKGIEKALMENKPLFDGLNTYSGHLVCKSVAESLNMPCINAQELIGKA